MKERPGCTHTGTIRPVARVRFDFDYGEIKTRLKSLDDRIDRQIGLVVDVGATKSEAFMKTNAPWHDDTGAARTGLHAVTAHMGSKHEIILAHSMDYGIWLEVKNSGKYEIINPTMRTMGKEIMRDFDHLLRRMA